MRQMLTLSVWLSLSAVSPLAIALVLGDAHVNSTIGSPLRATAPLLDLSNSMAPDSIEVSIAPASAFEALGLTLVSLAQSVRAEVKRRNGALMLELSSQNEVNEPWLDLLLEFQLPDGKREARELTLLLDPPEYTDRSSLVHASSSPSDSAPAAASVALALKHRVSTDNISTGNVSTDSASNSTSPIIIQRGDTLWSLAKQVRTPRGATTQQTMLALFKANPQAFPTGNASIMRVGATLRLPTGDELMARSQTDAIHQLNGMKQPELKAKPEAEPKKELGKELGKEIGKELEAGNAKEPSVNVSRHASIEIAGGVGSNTARNSVADAARLEVLDATRTERDALRDEMLHLREQVTLLRTKVEKLFQASHAQESQADHQSMEQQKTERRAEHNPVQTSVLIRRYESLREHSGLLSGVVLAGLLLLLAVVRRRSRHTHRIYSVAAGPGSVSEPSPEPSHESGPSLAAPKDADLEPVEGNSPESFTAPELPELEVVDYRPEKEISPQSADENEGGSKNGAGQQSSIEYQAPDVGKARASSTDATNSGSSLEQPTVEFTTSPLPPAPRCFDHHSLPDGYAVEVVEYSLQDSSPSVRAEVENKTPKHTK